MPREGIFARVICGGLIQSGDPVIVEIPSAPDSEKGIEIVIVSDETQTMPLPAFL